MMKRSVTQNRTWTWAASSSIEQDILKDGYITHIDFVAEITPSATAAGANQPDSFYRCIENFSIRGGSQTYFTLPAEQGGRLWHYMGRKQLKHYLGHGGQIIVAPANTYHPVMFRFHPGSRPLMPDGSINFFDMSAFIPAVEETSLKGVWLTTANTCLDDTITLSSATLKATVYMVQGSPEEIKAEMAAQGVIAAMTPASTAEVFPTTAVKGDYSEQRDLPTGGYLRGVGILMQDATATRPLRGSDEITQVAITMPSIGSRLIEVDAEALWLDQGIAAFTLADDAVVLGSVNSAPGVFYLPLKDRGQSAMGREYGLNLMGARNGDWKLGMTVATYAAGDDVLIWYDRLIPYVGSALR